MKLDFEVILGQFKVFRFARAWNPDPDFYYREDRRRGYIGNDYGEDDDEVDYSKMYQEEEDVNLFVSKIHFVQNCIWIHLLLGQTSRSW